MTLVFNTGLSGSLVRIPCLGAGLLAVVFFFQTAAAQQPVTLRFCNLQEARGSLFVAVYNGPDGFMDEKKAVFTEVIPVKQSGCMEKSIPLPDGSYAVSCFQDVNNNGRLDKTWVGIPKEPFAFSGSYTAKMRAPNWEEIRVRLKAGEECTLLLKNW